MAPSVVGPRRSCSATGSLLATFWVMDAPFALTETHRDFRDTMRRFADERIAPQAAEADRNAAFPKTSFDACVDLELPALGLPVEYGGAGADMISQAIMAEELARVCASTCLTILISKLAMVPVLKFGTEGAQAPVRPAGRLRRAAGQLLPLRGRRRQRHRGHAGPGSA